MDITPFRSDYLPDAAALFIQNFRDLRQQVSYLPDLMAHSDRVIEKLASMMEHCPGVAALEHGKLVGYLGWFLVDGFRGTTRKAAYCPEWAHGAADSNKTAIYRALYRAASAQWGGRHVHAITLLAHDHEAVKTWFWNGFGLTVVDAIRPMTPLEHRSHSDTTVRKADLNDVEMLAVLEAEHWQHYAQPPVLMAAQANDDAAGFTTFLRNPQNSAWLAFLGQEPAGYMRFEGDSLGAVSIVGADTTVAITGAYTRPAVRGKGAAVAVLDAALRDYAARGFTSCSVNFESFNPEAASFWMKYFEPVCFSVLRVPEITARPG